MSERKADKQAPAPWQVPVAIEDVAETGQHFDLVADNDVRAAVARVAGLRDLPRLEANFDVTRHGAGRIACLAGACRRRWAKTAWSRWSRSPTKSKRISIWCSRRHSRRRRPSARPARTRPPKTDSERPQRSWNGPEPLLGGVVDLGALATEFLILGLDPYPRKPGAVFEPPQDVKPDPGPFAALAGLKEKHGR